MKSGIVAVANIGSFRVYIGEPHQIKARWGPLLMQLTQGAHPNRDLQEEWEREKGNRRLTFHVATDLLGDPTLIDRKRLQADLHADD